MANKSTTSTEDWLRERRFAILAFVVCLTVGHLISRDIVSRNTCGLVSTKFVGAIASMNCFA